MKNTYRIKKIDHLTYTDEDWQHYYEFRIQSYALNGEPMPFNSLEELKTLNVSNITEHGEEIYQVWKNGQANGILVFSIGFKDDLNKRFTFLENYMNDRYLETNLLEMIFEKYLEYDEKSNSLAIPSKGGINDYVAEYFGASIGANADYYELTVKEANIEKIDTWLTEAPAKFPNLKIKFYDEIPDDLLEEYAALYTQMIEDIPVPSELGEARSTTAKSVKDLQEAFKLRNYCVYSYLIFNEDNQLIALTSLSINLKRYEEMEQWLTGVMKKYQGRGLSKWLKAAMFKKLVTNFPKLEKIETEAHPENYPSVGLSKQMGYKKMGTQKDFLIDRATIVKHLKVNT